MEVADLWPFDGTRKKNMFVTSLNWNHIRDSFTEEEKILLINATIAQCICPLGTVINLKSLPEYLVDKLVQELKQVRYLR